MYILSVYSEERIWIAKYTIFPIASLGATPNTPKEIFKRFKQNTWQYRDSTV